MLRAIQATFAFVVFAATCQFAAAQTQAQWQAQLARLRQQQQAPNIQWENTEVAGNIKAMQGAMLQVAASSGENWLLQVEARPQDIVFQSSADPAFVKVGMLVEFKAKVNKRGVAADPVQDLTIISVREGRAVGVQPEGGAAKGQAELFAPKPEETEKKGPKAKVDDDAVYLIAGQITKLGRLGDMTINCAGTTIKADLAKDAKVSVDVNHLQFAQVGDKVQIRARYPMGQKNAGQGLASQVSVTGSTTLGEPKKRVLPGKAAEKADDADKPAEKAVGDKADK